MAGSGSPRNGISPTVVNERTSLLAANSTYGHGTTEEAVSDDEATDIDPNEFDILLSRSESISTGLGIEVESQETSMLRGPRKYSNIKSGSRRSSKIRRRSSAGEHQDDIEEGDVESDEEGNSKSPFLAGVGVARFWLIFGGILACYFVACFDSTVRSAFSLNSQVIRPIY